MRKVGVLLIILVLLAGFVIAQNNDTNNTNNNQNSQNTQQTSGEGVEAGYQCLENLLEDKEESDLSLQEAIFATLALGSDSKLNSVIDNEEGTNCWPKSSCTIKETAQVLLAKDRINQNTEDIEAWLLDKNETATELTWFLQIDISNHVESSCTLSYQGSDKQLTVKEDMTLSGNPGQCFSFSASGFWLRVNNNCISEEFRISCDQDFVTSLLYQRQGSNTVFVSPNAHSSAALGTTTEKVNSGCFKVGGACDYEGTLWAALSLDHVGHDVSSYLPYLLALAEENKRFFPAAFLHFITQGNDQYSEVVQSQIQGQYWQTPNTPYNRFYDTSLAMLSLKSSSAQEFGNAQSYLLNIQTPEGCWNNNNIRDTAFVLYSGWGKSVSSGGGGGSGVIADSCLRVTGRQCVSLFACSDAGGTNLGHDCDAGVCCSVPLIAPSCVEQGGLLCSSTQQCSGTVVGSQEGSCCLGACQELPQENECQAIGGSCHSSCIEGEVQDPASCADAGLVCCTSSGETGDSDGGSIWIWVILLLILIVLIVFVIVFRKKLQLWWFNMRHKKKGPSRQGGAPGGMPPRGPPGRPMPQRPMRRPMGGIPQRRPIARKPTKNDKELEATLKKLREMGN